MNPAAPVMRMFLGLYEVSILKNQILCKNQITDHIKVNQRKKKEQIQIQSTENRINFSHRSYTNKMMNFSYGIINRQHRKSRKTRSIIIFSLRCSRCNITQIQLKALQKLKQEQKERNISTYRHNSDNQEEDLKRYREGERERDQKKEQYRGRRRREGIYDLRSVSEQCASYILRQLRRTV